jgi:hypothetical protein
MAWFWLWNPFKPTISTPSLILIQYKYYIPIPQAFQNKGNHSLIINKVAVPIVLAFAVHNERVRNATGPQSKVIRKAIDCDTW